MRGIFAEQQKQRALPTQASLKEREAIILVINTCLLFDINRNDFWQVQRKDTKTMTTSHQRCHPEIMK